MSRAILAISPAALGPATLSDEAFPPAASGSRRGHGRKSSPLAG